MRDVKLLLKGLGFFCLCGLTVLGQERVTRDRGESDRGRDATKSNRVDLDPGTVLQDKAAVYGVHTTNQAQGHSLEDYFITVGQGLVMFVKPAKTV